MVAANDNSEHEDVFISYAREDRPVVAKLADYLMSVGIRVFWDPEIRSGTDWRDKLDGKLQGVKCVLVLWSEHSITSEYVLEEADYGKSRQVLLAAKLDACRLPFGFRRLNTDDLKNWTGETPPPGITRITQRITELVNAPSAAEDRTAKDEKLRKSPKSSQTEHTSISNHEKDKAAVIKAVAGIQSAVESVENGYSELEAAQDAAKNVLGDRIASRFYAAAAEHFGQALKIIGDAKLQPARDGRSVGYFLSMERANALVYADPADDDDPIAEAIRIYTAISRDNRYKNDVPVHFRLGSALVRQSRSEASLAKAIRHLRKARQFAAEKYAQAGPGDTLLNEGTWLKIEIAKQLGFCNYLMSELPGVTVPRRNQYFDDAIQETRDSIEAASLTGEGSLADFTVLKARGNLIFLLAQRIREKRGESGDGEEIRKLIRSIKEPSTWAIAQNQVHIIDDIAFGAATIGDWQLAFDEAERNIGNFASLAVPNGLPAAELAMQARAKELRYFAELCLGCAARKVFETTP